MRVTPIKPEQVVAKKLASIPDFVIEVVNALIVEKWRAGSQEAVVKQKEIQTRIKQIGNGFKMEWLDFEPIFMDAGWIVVYDKPAYNENYEAFFKFTSS